MLHHRPCLYPKAVLQALLCAAFVFLLTNAEPAQAQTATGEMVYQPAGARLVLPENWRPTGIWAQNPTAGEQPNGLLFSGEAQAPTGEGVTTFTLNRFPAIAVPSEAFPQMTAAEQQQLCDGLLKNFTAELSKETGVAPAGAKAMIKRLNGWYVVMLTARFITTDTDIIINQIAYSLPNRVVFLAFYTQTPLISVIAPDISQILDNFQPDASLAPRNLPPRQAEETLDAYLDRIKAQ